jgi:hypothetical protein
MSRNFADMERELIEDLAPRTGRTLADWMAAIDAAGLAEKNAIIDWLRPQGFSFANASWLERIHNNGGRPIYLDRPGHVRPQLAHIETPSTPARPGDTSTAPPAAVDKPRPAPKSAGEDPARPAAAGSPDPARIVELLARGKAYRPLAEMLIRELRRALPEVQVVATGDLIGFDRPRRLGVLHVAPKELRLALDLGDMPFSDTLVKARVPGAGPSFTHMLVLSDARQIGQEVMALAQVADMRANPPPTAAPAHH